MTSYAGAFPPLGSGLLPVSLRITVAGQWRLFTAFPADDPNWQTASTTLKY